MGRAHLRRAPLPRSAGATRTPVRCRQWHPGLLGGQHVRASRPARRNLHPGHRGLLARLCGQDRRQARLLGGQHLRASGGPGGAFTEVSAGAYHTCAVRTDGTLTCWGDNAAGQASPAGGTFIQVSAGTLSHLRGPHRRQRGLLGRQWQGTSDAAERRLHPGERRRLSLVRGEDRRRPGVLGIQPLRASHTARGHLHRGARRRQSHLRDPERRHPDLLGEQHAACADAFVQISAGYSHTCGLHTDGTLTCSGNNTSGQATPAGRHLHPGQRGLRAHLCGQDRRHPDLLGERHLRASHPARRHLHSRSARATHTPVRVKTDGGLICWGDNTYGQAAAPAASSRK
jgi:hypothetical protein